MPVVVESHIEWSRLAVVPEQTFKPSAEAAAGVALKMRHERKHSGVGLKVQGTTAELYPTGPLGAVFERGRRGGKKIVPKTKKALAGGSFGPYADVIEGPMRPYPYVAPAGAWWASGGYNETARVVMAAHGLGA